MTGAPQQPDSRRCGVSGFSLVELMVAMTLTGVLSLVIYSLWINAMSMADAMNSTLNLNREARSVTYFLTRGVMDLGADAALGTADDMWVPGMRHVRGPDVTYADPNFAANGYVEMDSASSATNYYEVQDTAATANRVQVDSQRLRIFRPPDGGASDTYDALSFQRNATVTCTAAGTPHPDCAGAGDQAMGGMVPRIRVDPNSRAMGRQGVEVEFDLNDPLYAGRTGFMQEDYADTYRLYISNL